MSNPALCYEFTETEGFEPFLTQLSQSLKLRPAPPRSLSRTYYDSFDWRLYRVNRACYAESEADAPSGLVCWTTLAGNTLLAQLKLAAVPRFASEFPAGQLREKLAPCLGIRALLPLCQMRVQRHELALLSGGGKLVLRLYLERYQLVDADPAPALPVVVRLEARKSGAKALNQAQQMLQRQFKLAPLRQPILLTALKGLGRHPGHYSTKPKLKLQPQTPAVDAARNLLLQLLHLLELNRPGARDALDSEFLHDFRVSVRRTRAALGQIKKVFPAHALQTFLDGFAWLGNISGQARDVDVYLLKFEDYRRSLPTEIRPHLEPLRAFLQRRQREEHAQLAQHLDSPRYAELVQDWRNFLQAPPELGGAAPNAARPVLEVANQRIWKVYQRVLKQGKAITPASPAEDLHELRKTCKKLRYLLEFFQSLYSKEKISYLIKLLQELQENLGECQDYHVQVAHLAEFSRQMHASHAAPSDTLLAMGRLSASLDFKQTQVRADLGKRFKHFATEDHRAAFAELFTAPASPGKPA